MKNSLALLSIVVAFLSCSRPPSTPKAPDPSSEVPLASPEQATVSLSKPVAVSSLPSEDELEQAVHAFVQAFNSRDTDALMQLFVPSQEAVWVSNWAGIYSQSGNFKDSQYLFDEEGPLMYQAKMHLPETSVGEYDHSLCGGKAKFGQREFRENELGRWITGQVPDEIRKLARNTRAYLFFPLERLLVLWGHHDSGWYIVGIRALDWCENTPVERLIGAKPQKELETKSLSAPEPETCDPIPTRASISLNVIRGIFAHLQIVEVVQNAALAPVVPTYRRSRCPAGRDNRQTGRRSSPRTSVK